MSLAAASRRPVDVFAELIVDTPAGRLALVGDGATLAIAADRYGTLHRVGRRLLGRGATRAGRLSRLLGALHASGIGVSIRIGSREVARTGDPARSRLLSRALGLPGVRVRPFALLLAALGRSR